MNYKVITNAENTGLDLVVFESMEEAESAVELAKEMFNDASFEIMQTSEPFNTTYREWVVAPW